MRWNLCDRVEKFMKGYDTEPDYDAFWKERDYLRLADRVKVPVLVSHGQLDFNVKTWEGHAVVPGPEDREGDGSGPVAAHATPGEVPRVGRVPREVVRAVALRVDNGVEDEPAVRVQTNDGKWHLQETWGNGRTRRLRLAGDEFTYLDDGALTESEMLRGVGGRGTRG